MQIDVGENIADLLYEHNSVNIPGLGGFVSRYKPAMADQVQGELYPPSKALNFNGNLVADDGLLAQHLQEKLGVAPAEAGQAVEAYVKEIREAIERREIVVFPKVGRLYKDYGQNLQFLPDTTNFSLDAYGLPTVHFYPIARAARASSVRPVTGQPQAATTPAAALPGKNRRPINNLAIMISLAVLLLVIMAYFIFFYKPSGGQENAQRLPTSRVNISPSQVQGLPASPSNSNPDGETLPENSYPRDNFPEETEGLDTEGATAAPGQKYFVIGIGVFGNDANVQRLIKKIYEAGYEPFTAPEGRLTRVGIQKAYSSESEITATLKDVRKKFSKDAKVLRKLLRAAIILPPPAVACLVPRSS